MKEYWVYFDCSKVNENTYLYAVVVMDNIKTLSPIFKQVKELKVDEGNQYTVTLKCLEETLEFLITKDLSGKINISHQNKILIDWLQRGYANLTYDDIFDIVYMKLKELYLLNSDIYLGHIPPNINKAKKFCKVGKIKRKMKTELSKLTIAEEDLEEIKPRIKNKKVINFSEYKY